ncbi:APC family permease [Rhodococcus sp. ACS1]|uniref:Amino acid transporter n=1 Tax=Rhodococcus koreensis TaxID=99653 RepID=A0A1H4WEE8_9NOCA|nr:MULTISPECIES: APC family permease [Rhodococcus]PBC49909.1 APC family permease [Rhodococcus sp. ACS1]QSE80862.1 APC family permease [Rhodococcus koreensis]SEC90934.1 Amino acid transporter [Rhodococcus koreensis]
MTENSMGDRRLAKKLTWRDGMAMALTLPVGLFVTFGYLLGVVGAWTAITIWFIGAVISFLQCQVFAEMAAMFPRDSGGVARYAIEGWKKYFAPLGAIAAFGYWLGWSLSISMASVVFGELIEATWFQDNTVAFSIFGNQLGLEHLFALGAMLFAWAFNYFGLKFGATVNKVLGLLVVAGLAVITVACLVSPSIHWSTANLSWSVAGDWRTVAVVFYVTAWTIYAGEIVASFAPEYKDTARDTSKAMSRISLFMIVLFVVVPTALAGGLGEGVVRDNPVNYVAVAFDHAFGGAAWIGTIVIASALLISIISTTADGGRALFGLAQEGMTIKQLDWVNRWGVPGRSLTLDVLLNATVMVLVGHPVSILLASNLGYLLAIILGLAAFILLRKDRPNWPRPIRRSNAWIPVVAVLVVFNVFITVIGVLNPELLGYGGARESLVAVAVLLFSVVLYAYRRVVQDKLPMLWRLPAPAMPQGADALALEHEMKQMRSSPTRSTNRDPMTPTELEKGRL